MYVRSGTPYSLGELDSQFGWKRGADAPASAVDLRGMVGELQGIRLSYVKGGSQSTGLAVLGSGGVTKPNAINTNDTIFGALQVIHNTVSGLVGFSLRNDVRISSTPGYINISGAATTTDTILVFWLDRSGYSAF